MRCHLCSPKRLEARWRRTVTLEAILSTIAVGRSGPGSDFRLGGEGAMAIEAMVSPIAVALKRIEAVFGNGPTAQTTGAGAGTGLGSAGSVAGRALEHIRGVRERAVRQAVRVDADDGAFGVGLLWWPRGAAPSVRGWHQPGSQQLRRLLRAALESSHDGRRLDHVALCSASSADSPVAGVALLVVANEVSATLTVHSVVAAT
jgi:hypothetical protein